MCYSIDDSVEVCANRELGYAIVARPLFGMPEGMTPKQAKAEMDQAIEPVKSNFNPPKRLSQRNARPHSVFSAHRDEIRKVVATYISEY